MTTQIPANSDLDNYKTPGDYYVGSYSDSQTISNSPPGMPAGSFCLLVMNQGPNARGQFLRICTSNGNLHLYVRIQYGGSLNWSAWKELSLTDLT